MAKNWAILQLLFGYYQNHIQHLRNLIYCIGLGNAQIKSTHLHQSHITHIWYKSAHAWMDFAEVVSQKLCINFNKCHAIDNVYCGACCVWFGYLQYLPRAHAQGVKQSSVVVVVGTKIARSRVLGVCACYKHNQSVDIGEKLVCTGFEFFNKAY